MNRSLLEKFESPFLGTLKNRVVMAAMTRSFADKNHCATDLMKEYYVRRAKSGVALILTEGVVIHPSADGYKDVPRINTSSQVESWKKITSAVQAEGSKIFCQLWHCGRISHSDFTDGATPVSSTNVAAEGINRQNNKPFGQPEALSAQGIQNVHQYYVDAAKNAMAAGFDGVQLHLGHGYLADQFFDSRINTRTDNYGGSVENRCRFSVELIEKIMRVLKPSQVAVRISPSRDMNGVYDWPELEPMIKYFIPKMASLGVRILDISCARADYYQTSGRVIRMVRPMWSGLLMGGASLTPDQASEELAQNYLDMITWGRFLIANPDLVERIKNGTPLNEFQPSQLSELY